MIRNAQSTDAEAIRNLIIGLGYTPSKNLNEKLRRLSAHPDETLLVYEADTEVVAFLSLHFIPQLAVEGDFARISYFAVKESVRSRGIGHQFEEHITTLARQRNCDRIEVHCHSRRTDAHRFYERQGYEESPKYFVKSLRSPEH